jgi:hypothetical protein
MYIYIATKKTVLYLRGNLFSFLFVLLNPKVEEEGPLLSKEG